MAKGYGMVSECCGAKIKLKGVPDFFGCDDICTMSFFCTECNKACNVVNEEKKPEQ